MRFDFPTVVHARGLMYGNTVGYGTRDAPDRVAAADAAAAARDVAAGVGASAADTPAGFGGAMGGGDGNAWAAPRSDGTAHDEAPAAHGEAPATGGSVAGGRLDGVESASPAAGVRGGPAAASNRVFPASAAVAMRA